ncbi:hypothetical protein PAMA_012899 [Pampus argenteus]
MSNRNQGTKDPPHLYCHPAHKDLCRSLSILSFVIHPSIHPPVRLWRVPVRPTDVSRRQVESSLTRAPLGAVQGPRRCLECHANSILVVDKVKRVGAVPSVSIMGQRCCSAVVFLWYSNGDAVSYIIREQRAWPGGWGEGVGGDLNVSSLKGRNVTEDVMGDEGGLQSSMACLAFPSASLHRPQDLSGNVVSLSMSADEEAKLENDWREAHIWERN